MIRQHNVKKIIQYQKFIVDPYIKEYSQPWSLKNVGALKFHRQTAGFLKDLAYTHNRETALNGQKETGKLPEISKSLRNIKEKGFNVGIFRH